MALRCLRTFLLALAAIALSLMLAAVPAPLLAADNEAVGKAIEAIIKEGQATIGSEDDDQRIYQVYTFYFDRSFKPVWVRDTGPKSKAKDFLAEIKTAEVHGLLPTHYRVRDIEERMGSVDPKVLGELDMLITRAFIDYASDLNHGRIEPSEASSENAQKPLEFGPVTLIDGAEAADSIKDYLSKLEPDDQRYHRLKDALAQYRAIAAMGGLPLIPEGARAQPGQSDRRMPILRKFLVLTGDLDPQDVIQGPSYDPKTAAAVKWFQYRHGLAQDGVIGPTTLSQMNVPVQDRIRQIVVNLERRRWMNRDLGNFYIFVNLADQYLKVVRKDKTVHTALLVVGKPFTSTPVFSEDMKYIVFNPYWYVPPSIANKEYLPVLRKDPGYLQRQHIRLLAGVGDSQTEVNPFNVNWNSMTKVPYQLRQDSGDSNALGKIKFMFPNRFNVYLHDTPSKSLFNKDLRVFSHGCMRVQNPDKLAEVLLRDQGWTMEKIEGQFASPGQRIVNLKRKIPVHVTYLTAFANKDGSVHFRRDVYERDEKVYELLVGGDFDEH